MTWLPEDRSNCGVKSSSTGFITCGDKTFSSVACAILAAVTELVTSTANAVIDGRNFHDVTIIRRSYELRRKTWGWIFANAMSACVKKLTLCRSNDRDQRRAIVILKGPAVN